MDLPVLPPPHPELHQRLIEALAGHTYVKAHYTLRDTDWVDGRRQVCVTGAACDIYKPTAWHVTEDDDGRETPEDGYYYAYRNHQPFSAEPPPEVIEAYGFSRDEAALFVRLNDFAGLTFPDFAYLFAERLDPESDYHLITKELTELPDRNQDNGIKRVNVIDVIAGKIKAWIERTTIHVSTD